MDLVWIAALCCFLVCFPQTPAWATSTCGRGQYRVRHGHCSPCRSCGDLKIISPCSPTHDTVCADQLRSMVIHFPCSLKQEWGVFVEDKVTSFYRNLTEKKRTKASIRSCNILQRFRKRIFVRRHNRHHHHNRCDEGTYEWTKASKSENSTSPLDCRPCSQCSGETRVMVPCNGLQDTFCSFGRINNTLELFSIKCLPQGPSIQVYSSDPPSAPKGFLDAIEVKLRFALCSHFSSTILMPELNEEKHFNHSIASTNEDERDEEERIYVTPASISDDAAGASDHQPNESTELERSLRKVKQKCQRYIHSAKMLRKCVKKEWRGSDRSYKGKRRKKNRNRAGKNNTILDLKRICREKKDRGQLCEALLRGHRRARVLSSPREGEKDDSISITQGFPTVPPKTTTRPPVLSTTSESDDDGDAAAPERQTARYSTDILSTKARSSDLYIIPRNNFISEEVAVQEQEEDTETVDIRLVLPIGLMIGVAILVMGVCCAVWLWWKRRKRQSYAHKGASSLDIKAQVMDMPCCAAWQHKESMKRLACTHNLAISFDTQADVMDMPLRRVTETYPSSTSAPAVRLIVDPLRPRNRPRSHDSGYTTIHSEGSDKGSHVLCRESQSSFFPVEPVCVTQTLTRNAVSSCEVANIRDSSPSSAVIGDRASDTTAASGADSRRTQSLSEDHSAPDGCPRPRRLAVAGLWSSPPLHDWSTEPQCAREGTDNDEDIENSQESVFSYSTCLQDNIEVSESLDEEGSRAAVLCFAGPSGSLSLDRGSEVAVYQFPSLGDDPPLESEDQASSQSSDMDSERNSMIQNRGSYSSSGTGALLLDEDPASPQLGEFPKSRSFSGDSSSSSTSSSVSLRIRIPLTDIYSNAHSDWLQKSSVTGPENFLSAYSSSIMTQTEDWTKTNLRARPVFSTCWQGCQTFTATGGTWSLTNSDVRLEVPPNAVPSGSYVDVTAATYTNLSHVRQVLNLENEAVMAGPLVEFDAGDGFQFQQRVFAYIPHRLPPGVSPEQVKLYHVDKNKDGELDIQRMPCKREYDLKQENATRTSESGEALSEGPVQAEDDIGYFQLLPSGELVVVTKRFCGYVCAICSHLNPEPQIHLVATAKQIPKSTPSGSVRQVSMCLHLWDRKITITDFKRDYLRNRQVGEQRLHVIDDYEDSLVHIVFTINEDESQPQWKHAMRPGTAADPEPIFPAERSFPLREVLCCQAKDSPRCVEWLAENVQGPGEPCYDFQCFIDVTNKAHPANSQWQQQGVPEGTLQKRVTLFIGDVNNGNDHAAVAGGPHELPLQARGIDSYGRKTAAQQCQCHQHPHQQLPSYHSNTPFGQMEQGPSVRLDLSDMFDGWQTLSTDVRQDSIQSQVPPDPTPPPHPLTVPTTDQDIEDQAQGRPLVSSAAAEAALPVPEGGLTAPRPYQQARMPPTTEERFRPDATPGKNRLHALPSGDRRDAAIQYMDERRFGNQTAMLEASPHESQRKGIKSSSSGALHHLPPHHRTHERRWSESQLGLSAHFNPNLEVGSKYESSIPIHHQNAGKILLTDPDRLVAAGRPPHPELREGDAGVLVTANGADDPPQCGYGAFPSPADQADQPEMALTDSSDNINLFYA